MAKINNYHLYDFQEQDKFDGLVNDTSTNPIQNKAVYEYINPKEKNNSCIIK